MKRTAVVLASLLVAACASSQKTNLAQDQQSSQQKSPTVSSATVHAAAAIDLSKLNAEIQKLQQQSDYFDFNKYSVKTQYLNVIQKEAEFIKSHTSDAITLEGNADERGSDGYNLALGEKRAEAVQQALIKYGVPAGQIKVITLGKEKPRLTCHAEKCWKENRRVDFTHKLS